MDLIKFHVTNGLLLLQIIDGEPYAHYQGNKQELIDEVLLNRQTIEKLQLQVVLDNAIWLKIK